MIYVAAPYNHKQPEIIAYRIEQVERVLATLNSQGKMAFSPLLMHHCQNKGVNLPSSFEFWNEFCTFLLKGCSEMIVLCLEGWEDSEGVSAEIKFCSQNGIPISFQDLSEFF